MRVILNDWMTTGLKFKILGYRSIGLSVPEVMTTLWNLLKTGFMARLASRQLNCTIVKAISVDGSKMADSL